MLDPIEQIKNNIQNWLDRHSVAADFDVSLSQNLAFGDYVTNVAMVSIKKVEEFKSPKDLANTIVDFLQESTDLNEMFEKIEIAGPGFINFYLSKKYLEEVLSLAVNKEEKFGFSENLKDQKVMVEFTDPNPFKEFHIGHLYSNIVGESLSRLYESQGAKVMRVNYQGDVGLHVAKAIYGMRKLSDEMPEESSSLGEKSKFLGKAYALGASAYEKDKGAKDEIQSLNKKIYDQEPEVVRLYKIGREWSLAHFDEIYKRLGTKFENYYFESEVGMTGSDLVNKNIGKVFVKDKGAVIFQGEKYGLHNRVFINSLGIPTYEAKELALASTKYKDFSYDKSLVITGNEIKEYFRVVMKALSFINPELEEKTVHITHGMVRLSKGKMSSRTGNVVTGEWLLDEAVNKLKSKFPDMNDEISEKVGVGAVKYALLKHGVGHDIEFDFDESISFEGNSGPYLQYTYARTQSVLKRSKNQESTHFAEQKAGIKNVEILNFQLNKEEDDLLRFIVRLPEIVTTAQVQSSPNLLANYLFELSQKFNLFYQKHRIIGEENEGFRLSLTAAVGQVIKNGLNLLGIETVEKM